MYIMSCLNLLKWCQVDEWESVLSSGMAWMKGLNLTIPGPKGEVPVRQVTFVISSSL
jgi:hypothetical protein